MTGADQQNRVAGATGRHALGWLVAANAVGVLLAALLVWPGLNDALAPLTYGRWVPLHLDWQLYGWCALPLVGVLLAWFLDLRQPLALVRARVGLGAWSLALALGGLAWLGGVTSGKMFLEWHGWARPLLPAAMLLLWMILALAGWRRRGEPDRSGRLARNAVLLGLAVVPAAIYWSAGREVYPSINPDSGGATGARLLASTLGIVTIYGFVAEVLGLARPDRRIRFWGYLAFSIAVCLGIGHGNRSHHEPAQFLGLATLLGWLPLVWSYSRTEAGVPGARRWWVAAFVWWSVLVASGLGTFLPGVAEHLKFTNALVAHAHLALAGLVTSANLAVLVELRAMRVPRNFWLWQGAGIAHVLVLSVLGWFEADNAAALFLSAPWTQAVYAARLAIGAVLLLISLDWWWTALRPKEGAAA